MNSPVDELKPCPFCGGYPKFPEAKDVFGTCYEAGCHHCGLAWLDMQIIDCFDYPRDKVHASYNEETHQYGLEYIEEVRRQAIGRWNTRAECPDSVEEAGQSRSTPPPVAGEETERVIKGLKRLLEAVCDKDRSKWEREAYLSIPAEQDDTDHILSDAIDLLAALQHQDCVHEHQLRRLIHHVERFKEESPMRKELQLALEQAKQSLERKNGQK